MSEPTTEPTDGDVQPETLPAVAVDTSAELQAFAEYAKSLPTDDPEEVQTRILESLMRATSPDDILRAGEATPATDVLNIPLTIMGIRGSESSFEDGGDIYLHVDAKVKGNGDSITFSCGARDVVVKLIRLDQLHMLPIDAVLQRSTKATRAGYYPIFLRALDGDGEPF